MEVFLPSIYYSILFYLYWGIALLLGGLLIAVLWRERDRNTQLSAAILLAPVVLRILMLK